MRKILSLSILTFFIVTLSLNGVESKYQSRNLAGQNTTTAAQPQIQQEVPVKQQPQQQPQQIATPAPAKQPEPTQIQEKPVEVAKPVQAEEKVEVVQAPAPVEQPEASIEQEQPANETPADEQVNNINNNNNNNNEQDQQQKEQEVVDIEKDIANNEAPQGEQNDNVAEQGEQQPQNPPEPNPEQNEVEEDNNNGVQEAEEQGVPQPEAGEEVVAQPEAEEQNVDAQPQDDEGQVEPILNEGGEIVVEAGEIDLGEDISNNEGLLDVEAGEVVLEDGKEGGEQVLEELSLEGGEEVLKEGGEQNVEEAGEVKAIVGDKEEEQTTQTPATPAADPFAAEISFTQINANSTKQSESLKTCGVISLLSNYHKVSADITFGQNIKKFMLSETRITSCQQLKELKCPADDTFCHVQSTAANTQFHTSPGACTGSIYLYIEQTDVAQPSTLDVNLNFVNNTPCGLADPKSKEVKCAALSPSSCQNDDACADDCIWAKCSLDIDHQVSYKGGYCVPTSFSRNQVQDKCNTIKEFFEAKSENQLIQMDTCPDKEREDVQRRMNGFMIFLIVLGSLFGICVVCSCFYRYQMAKNKRAPFEPPQYCPESFFPRPYGSRSNNPHRNLNETVEMQDSSYRPPDMYQE